MKITLHFSGVLISMAWRNVWRQKKRSYLVISTALVGMISVIFLMGLMNGFVDSMLQSGFGTGMGHVQVRPAGYLEKRKLDMKFQHPHPVMTVLDARTDDGGFHHAPHLERMALLRMGSVTQGVVLVGIEPEKEKKVSDFAGWMVEGKYLSEQSPESEFSIPAMIGTSLANKLEVGVGDSVVLSIGKRGGGSVSLRASIEGLFESPLEGINRNMVMVSRKRLSILYDGTPDNISSILYRGKDRAKAFALKKSLVASLDRASLSQEAEVVTYSDLIKDIEDLLTMAAQFQKIFYIIVFIGFALTLTNAVLMSVFERTKEIGIQRALGTRKSVILTSILIESFFLTAAGSIVGFILGGVIVVLTGWSGISFKGVADAMSNYPNFSTVVYPVLTLSNIVTAFSISTTIGLLSGIYPAWMATKVEPIKAMQGRL